MEKSIIYLAIKNELNNIQSYYDYDPCIQEHGNDTISWEDSEGNMAFIDVINDNRVTFWAAEVPDDVRVITYQQFMEILHGHNIPDTKKKEKTGKELMSEMAHLMTFLSNMGYDTSIITLDNNFEIQSVIKGALLDLAMTPTNPVKDAFQ